MTIDPIIANILDRAQAGHAPSKSDCVTLLERRCTSIEASATRAVADALSRERFNNEAIILGQIGFEIDACPGDCKFCSFAESYTQFTPSRLSMPEILADTERFTASGELYALFLMSMHTFDFEHLLDIVVTLREKLPAEQQIVVNIGDFDRSQAELLNQVGVNGAYHVCRLREGEDTALDPEARKATIRSIKEAGLDWYYCCEPIGPEHSAEELAEQMFLGIEYGCFQHAAMRRVYNPASPLAHFGQISELRLAQVTAVVALASLACSETKNIAVHEPNLIGLTSGANVIYAEAGANPRDTEENTTGHRGRDIPACRTMLYEAGFEHLLVSPGRRISLAEAYKSV